MPSDRGAAPAARTTTDAAPERARGRNLASGVLLGIGVAAFIDEAVFHQLLHWHHFYDRSTPDIGLVSDGIFHAFGWFATVGGLFLLADLSRRHSVQWMRWWGAVLLGSGGFQLFDGTVLHKALGVHQIRYGVDLLPYDLVWNGVSVALIVVGALLLVSARRRGDA
ncbi:DUF2243 domain-containing protein [Agromyces indicus]|uniref:DUF2243 domain-containing protein n=1 Tax=Agromyces indicus TaxID=758919 RepID=A0ABU1FM08_9MICO|nr:DUF2243 domain-containing protein [Agromyces indicus]MDR5692764.1 DUF2243 domain-containing protein [Agromyces indicus]